MLDTSNFPAELIEEKPDSTNVGGSQDNGEYMTIESRRRSWRMAFVDLQILSLLRSQRLTGYSIRKNLNSRFGILISFGTLYPRLKFLERIHVLKSVVANRSPNSMGVVTYELTDKGMDDLKTGLVAYQNSLRTIEQILEIHFE
jgi:DNA-binding PadR family transcriptional regulator